MSYFQFDGQSDLTKSTQTPSGICFSHGAEKWEAKRPKMGLGDSFPPSVTIMSQESGGITATFRKAVLHKKKELCVVTPTASVSLSISA